MIVALIIVIVLCLFTAGMNFSFWLEDQTRTRNIIMALINASLGVINLVALVGRASNL